MVGGSLRVLRLLPPLKLVAMILLRVALNTINHVKYNMIEKKTKKTKNHCVKISKGAVKLLRKKQ
jgi:hypothetical protein